jgi:hypothetical protein
MVYLVTAVFLATHLLIPLSQTVHTAADSDPYYFLVFRRKT